MTTDTSNSSAPDLVGWTAGPETRGTLTLVWSCVITIFACTWTVLHLNVPGRDEGSLWITLRKFKWMAINILFPEFIFAKAVCDLRLALEELREFDENVRENEKILGKWTSSEGSKTHEWSWEFEYPLWAHTLYRWLQLKPPQKGVKQKQPPLWVSKAFPLLFTMPKSESHSDTESQRSADSDGPGHSSSQALSSNLEVASNRQDLHVTQNEREDQESGASQPPGGARPITWRTVQKWTVVHSYYAQMGGILYQYSDETDTRQYYSCTASMLTARYSFIGNECRTHLFKHLILGEQDIRDKSKADWVLKGIAIAQVSWLVLSVIVRSITDLPITQLEIATISFATISFATISFATISFATISFAIMAILSYTASWWKPKDISCPTVLQTPAWGKSDRTRRPDQPQQAYAQSFMLRLKSPAEAADKAWDIEDELERVPNDRVWIQGDSPILYTLMAISSFAFGGLHCLAWNFKFPSESELLCWKVASVISAILPAITLGISLGLHFLAVSFTNFTLISSLLRKLEPLIGLHSEFWTYIKEPNWATFFAEAQSFLVRNPKGRRDWERRPLEPGLDANLDEHPEFRHDRPHVDCRNFANSLRYFLDEWEQVRLSTPYAARVSRGAWFSSGYLMQVNLKTDGVLDLWLGYEGFVMGEHGFNIPNMPGHSPVALIVQAYEEVAEEVKRWEKIQAACDQASLVLSIISGVIYTIARLVILVLLITCLRETPAGVYQVTPWVNFLPNFS